MQPPLQSVDSGSIAGVEQMASEASQLTLRAKDAFESTGWRLEVLECRIWGSGLRVEGLGFRIVR